MSHRLASLVCTMLPSYVLSRHRRGVAEETVAEGGSVCVEVTWDVLLQCLLRDTKLVWGMTSSDTTSPLFLKPSTPTAAYTPKLLFPLGKIPGTSQKPLCTCQALSKVRLDLRQVNRMV